MIDLRLLEQLVAFNDYGTLSNAAEKLLISQPALTRSMQRLEDELGVQLFIRSKNKMTLTETGYYAVSQARQLLRHSHEFESNIHHFSLKQSTLFVGAIAPGPIMEVEARLKEKQYEQQINCQLASHEELTKGLLNEIYQVIITTEAVNLDITNPSIISKEFFTEQLYLSVPKDHALSEKASITTEDLDGLTMLLRAKNQLGIWTDFVESLKNTKFIEQISTDAFNELIKVSNLPSFTTNMTHQHMEPVENRRDIPIHIPGAAISFYVNSLKKNRHFIHELLSKPV